VTRSAEPDPRTAFERLFRETRTDLLAYLLRRTAEPEDAADLLAETYLVAWGKIDAVPQGEQARLWLFGVARNLLLKGATRRRSRHVLAERLAVELRGAVRPYDAAAEDERGALRAALSALSDRDREIVTLTAWEGLTPRAIAAITGSSANVVRVRLHRARARLRRELDSMRPRARDHVVLTAK